jgi:hypothetical protein
VHDPGWGTYFFNNLYSGYDLNVEGGAIALGARLIQWPHISHMPNAMFKIVPIEPFEQMLMRD